MTLMNGQLLEAIMSVAPELVPLIRNMGKAKNEEVLALLMAEMIRSNKDGFSRISQQLETTTNILKYTRDAIEGLAKSRLGA